jgi:nanoRNase/pAp phosphatase (c-di-AMP/oligoRNAs hydrolase)
MSEDREKIVGDIEGLARATITAYVKYIDKHREMDNASVITASALYLAIVVDALSFEEDDPPQSETITLIIDATMGMLRDTTPIRGYMRDILKSVIGKRR